MCIRDSHQAAWSVDADAALKPLFRLARDGEDAALIRALSDIADRTDWPRPARDRVLHAFAVGLGDLDMGAVGGDVLDYLESLEAGTWVPLEDHPDTAIPLFNVSAAASGVRNAWRRQAAAATSGQYLAVGSQAWLDRFIGLGPTERQGMLDGLEGLEPGLLRQLGESALPRLGQAPALTAVAARAGLLLRDALIFSQAVALGSGPGLTPSLRAASDHFNAAQSLAILEHVIDAAPDGNASLALAQLAPVCLHEPAVADLLFETLEDRRLGATAALVLAGSSDGTVRERLRQTAAADQSLAAKRAALALTTTRWPEPGAKQR